MGILPLAVLRTPVVAAQAAAQQGPTVTPSKPVAIASDQVARRADRLVADTLTEDRIRACPEFKESASYKDMDEDETGSVRAIR